MQFVCNAVGVVMVSRVGLGCVSGRVSRCALSVFLAGYLLLSTGGAQAANVATATIEVAPQGVPVLSTAVDMTAQGYVEQEWFLSGAATTYSAQGSWGKNGAWAAVANAARSPYKTRILVRYPQDPSRFNGTVIVEWLNVASGRELEAGWLYSHDYYMRSGYAYVAVTTLQAGLSSLKASNASRYSSLSLPTGNVASYDVFSQVALAVKQQGSALFGGSQPTRVLALGASQGATYLATYANAIQPLAQVFDGILIQGRPYLGADLTGALNANLNYALIRPSLAIPVLQIQGEFDLITGQGLLFRQPDTLTVHTWEVAGASHESVSALLSSPAKPGSGLAALVPPKCALPFNSLHIEWVINAGWTALDRWSRGLGTPPSTQPISTLFGVVTRDIYGNARGGVRLPEINVPRVTYSIVNSSSSVLNLTDAPFCLLAGSTLPMNSLQLALMYPGGYYKTRYQQAAQAAVSAGVLLQEDASLALSLIQ